MMVGHFSIYRCPICVSFVMFCVSLVAFLFSRGFGLCPIFIQVGCIHGPCVRLIFFFSLLIYLYTDEVSCSWLLITLFAYFWLWCVFVYVGVWVCGSVCVRVSVLVRLVVRFRFGFCFYFMQMR